MTDFSRFHLPAYAISDAVNRALAEHSSLVITAPPGAGKSTLLPLTMLQGVAEGKILMLEPRRLAARQIAERMAWMLGEEVGQTVGYRVRRESCIGKATRIEVITEGILTRMLIDDASLSDVALIIFDEFHERNLNSDMALTLAREAQSILRPDLRLVVMSATIDAQQLCAALHAPLIESEGRMFPVDIHYADDLPWHDAKQTVTAIAQAVLKAHRAHEGDILVFLPGEAEILRLEQLLTGALGETQIYPLYGQLSNQRQRQAIAPSGNGERKVVLATPIAETSLTIEGVRVVIDAGRHRKMVFDPRTALSRMETVPISMDMACQRTGRAGRVAAGVCYRLWSKATEQRMAPCRTPEIEEADLSGAMLDVAAWGETDVMRLPWLTPPPPKQVSQAQALLRLLQAIDAEGRITPHGRLLAKQPCHPRIGQLLLQATTPQEKAMVERLADILDGTTRPNPSNGANLYAHLPSYAHLDIGAFVAAAYPERIAHRLPDAFCQYRLSGGETAVVDSADSLSAHPWLAIAHMNGNGGRIFLAAPIDETVLNRHATERDNLSWDNKAGRLVAQRERRIGNLLLESKPLEQPSRQAVEQVLCEAARKWGTSMFDFSDEVLSLQRRVAQVADWHPDLQLPDLSTEAFLARATDWLPYYIGTARTTAEMKKLNLQEAMLSLISYEQQQALDRLVPSHLVMPSGRRIRVEYRQGAELPIVRVRLQECFGMMDTPRVDDGQRPVLMELLSPGFKPVQLTSDLRSFWTTTYFEVRKELKRRYPKHAWPDNPQSL